MEEEKIEIKERLTYDEIKNLIYTVRGKQVMLDSDVAMLYNYETKKINQTVKRNKDRFPENFCFQLTENEFQGLRSQFVTSKIDSKDNETERSILRSQFVTLKQSLEINESRGGRRYLPYVFTEQGIAMLSGLLKNDIAVQVSINIMNAFVEIRKFIYVNNNLFERVINIENTIDKRFIYYDKKFDEIFNQLQVEENIKQRIFFNGQIWDSYILIVDLVKKANKKIIIIDNYIDDSVLKMLTKKKENVEVNILTSEKSNIQGLDIKKFNKEYPMLKIEKTNKFHDRFIILDEKEMYHLGASIKDLGKKCFGINKIEDIEIIEKVINL